MTREKADQSVAAAIGLFGVRMAATTLTMVAALIGVPVSSLPVRALHLINGIKPRYGGR